MFASRNAQSYNCLFRNLSRCANLRWIAVLPSVIFVSCQIFAQLPASSVKLAAPVRDPSALGVLQLSLDAMGGAAAWNIVKSTRVSGQYAGGDSSGQRSITWTNDWSNGRHRFRRDTKVNGSDITYIQDGSNAPKNISNPTQPAPPTLDFVDSSIVHLPAVAITHVISDTSYGLSMIESPDQTHAKQCVRVTHQMPPSVKAIWCFSPENLPSIAIISVANLTHQNTLQSKRVVFDSFTQHDGLTVPSGVTITYSWGATNHYVFSSFEPNPVLRNDTFVKGQP